MKIPIIRTITLLFLCIAVLPFSSFAAEYDPELATVTINVNNHEGDEISGNWFLHKGNISRPVVRNGLSGESFQLNAGTYYLQVIPVRLYDVFKIDRDNTVTVSAGETTVFNLTYYPDQAYLDALGLEEVQPEPEVVPEPEPTTEPVVEDEPKEETPEPEVAPKPYVYVPIVYVPTFETDPVPEIPMFETAPSIYMAGGVGGGSLTENLGNVPMLAETGQGILFLLFPSVIGGLMFVRRKK